MSVAEVKRSITPEELEAMRDAVGFELVDGELVDRNMSVLSSLVEGICFALLQAHCRQRSVGLVWPGTLGFRCFGDDQSRIRRPDVSVIVSERVTADLLNDGFCPIAPDLAVEVLSPGDFAHEIVEKVEEYLAAGVRLVWVVDPEARLVDVYRRDGSNRVRENDALIGDPVLPEFRCAVKDLFPSPPPAAREK